MALVDKEKWDKTYEEQELPHHPTQLVTKYAPLVKGNALDIACGIGRHSKYLAKSGFSVKALDISSVAIAQLQGLENIEAKEVDFDTYVLANDRYDLIVCTYFLDRKLFSQMIAALKPEGILIIETFLQDEENERTPSNPAFRLQKGELHSVFRAMGNFLHLKEYWDTDYRGCKTMKTSMVLQKYKA